MTSGVERVVFRKWGNGDIIALFLDWPVRYGQINSYEHIGQHGAAVYSEVIRRTTMASQVEYAALFNELCAIGYTPRSTKRRSRHAMEKLGLDKSA